MKEAKPEQYQELLKRLTDQNWRLNNLYRIINKEGIEVQFVLNAEQQALYDARWYENLILKARQLGFSTFIAIFMLDCCLFDVNVACGIVDITIDDAKGKLDKIRFAYEGLPRAIKDTVKLKRSNAYEMVFSNGSSVSVGTSHRGGTLQILHVSEFGKICAKFPDRAREIRTGALNTIQAGQLVFIESTAEGQDGSFYIMCQLAQEKQRLRTPLTKLDFKFHFSAWHQNPDYTLDPTGVVIIEPMQRYFETLRLEKKIPTSAGQQAWYVKKAETQEEDMKREYPSTPEEAFEASVEGAYFGKHMAQAELDGRVCEVPYDRSLPVETIWDIGVNDETSIIFIQRWRQWCHIIDYYECSDEYLPHFAEIIRSKPYAYKNFWMPPDIKVREWGAGRSRVESMIKEGMNPSPLKADYGIGDLIQAGRLLFPFCKFDTVKTTQLRKALKNYRKTWDDERATWRDEPYHNWASNGASAFMYTGMIWDPVKEEPAKKEKLYKDVYNTPAVDLWKTEERRERI